MVLNVIFFGSWWIIKIFLEDDQTGNSLVHLQMKESDPKGKDQKNVTNGMSKSFGHQLEQLTCLLKIRPSGLRICGLCAQECLISLKCQTARAVENGSNVSGHTRDYGNAISSLRTWDFCLLQGCGHTCQRSVGAWKRLNFQGLLTRDPHQHEALLKCQSLNWTELKRHKISSKDISGSKNFSK